ncbi:hypothetical protein FCV25MIE_00703, partial [Fagus crenata]
ERYRVLLSDVVSSQHAMLAAQLNHRVTSGRVVDLQFLEIELSNLVHLGQAQIDLVLCVSDLATKKAGQPLHAYSNLAG